MKTRAFLLDAVFALATIGCSMGCSIDEEFAGTHRLVRDGSLDALDGSLRDGALPDGRVPNGGSGSQLRDGGNGLTILPDGRVIGGDEDGGGGGVEQEIDVSGCSLSNAESFEIAVPFVRDGFGIAAGFTDFGLAHLRDAECKHGIDTAVVDSTSGTPVPSTIFEGCDTMRDVTLAGLADGYQLAWTDNATNTVELHTLELDAELQVPEGLERTTLTTNNVFERSPILAAWNDMPVVAWVSDDGGSRSIFVQHLAAGASAIAAVPETAGHEPIELALSQVGPQHLAMAWVEEVANRGIWMLPLDGTGAPQGDPVRLTDFAAPGSTVDIANRKEDGGAVIYSVGVDQVNFDVRYQRLWGDATPRGNEIKVIARPLQAKDASIARLGGGYVVAYRAIPDGNVIMEPEVRIVFVSKDGNLSRDPQGRVQTFHVTPAARDGSPIQAEVSVDGQLLLAFVDGSDTAENTLRVIRRRLDCPL